MGCGELLLVVGKVFHLEAAGRQKTMAFRRVAAFDARNLERHDVPAQQAQDRMQRAHPKKRARAPSHRLWPRELRYGLGDDRGDDISGGAARLLDHSDIEVAPLLVPDEGGFG